MSEQPPRRKHRRPKPPGQPARPQERPFLRARPDPAIDEPERRRPRPQQPPAEGPPTDWGDVADWYDQLVGEEGSEYQQQVVFPGVLKMLGLEPGEKVLDVACGQGVFCRVLRERGARPTGVDAASELIYLARQRSGKEIEYRVGDARDLDFLPAGSFDAATCILAIQNIDQAGPVFKGVHHALAPGGRFVLVMMHPCFRGPAFSSWGWDEQQKVQYRRVDRYLVPRRQPIVTHPGKDPGRYTWTFHRPIQSYFRALHQAGLVVDMLEEWASHKTSQPGKRAEAENQARKEFPMFMALRALKLRK